ncbi:hypothetical protein DIPPA_16031 [Diplonema papillatum]|nr:hypothetical protein DIPPA_16031 [Diplonema papillatum]
MAASQIGGGYAALMKGKKNKGAGAAPTKPKASKVISLKDTAEKNPAAKSDPKPKPQQENKPAKETTPVVEKDLTRREVKQERAGTDRHVQRHGVVDHGRETKDQMVANALEAANEKPSEAISEKKREFEEREAERKKREEDEERKITYADYQKSLVEKKNELANLQRSKERKVDTKSYAGMTEMKKEDDAAFSFMKMKKEKAVVEAPAKPVAKKGGKKQQEVAAAAPAAPAKKNKFVKSADIQVGFYSKPTNPQPRGPPRGPRRDFQKPEEKKTDAPAATEAAPQGDAAPAAAAPAAEANGDADEAW